jgi:predicted Zn-dependent peptidase
VQLLDRFEFAEVDGVPVVWTPGPAPLNASLIFRVGRADEPFVDGGITHLVEHLVMRGVGRMPIGVNAEVGPLFTSFDATGSAIHVVDFLARVCRELDRLDAVIDGAVDVERQVLAAETEHGGSGAAVEAASLRYGCRGVGRAAYREVGVQHVTTQAILAWKHRWFSRDNAVLALTGPVPDGLRLALPAGQRADVPRVSPRNLRLPAWDSDCGGTALSLPLPAADGIDLAVGRFLARAAEDAVRHEKGLAYDVDSDGVQLDPLTTEVAIHADNAPDRAAEVAGLLLDCVERIAQTGPSVDDLEADRAEALEALSDPRLTEDAVAAAARQMLTDAPVITPAEMYRRTERRTPTELQEAVRAAADQLLVLLPEDQELDRAGVAPLQPSSHPVPDGRELRPRLFTGAPRGARLVVGEKGVALRVPDGDLVALWDDVVGVSVEDDGTHVLQTADGPAVPIFARAFKGGDQVIAQARARLSEALFIRQSTGS